MHGHGAPFIMLFVKNAHPAAICALIHSSRSFPLVEQVVCKAFLKSSCLLKRPTLQVHIKVHSRLVSGLLLKVWLKTPPRLAGQRSSKPLHKLWASRAFPASTWIFIQSSKSLPKWHPRPPTSKLRPRRRRPARPKPR